MNSLILNHETSLASLAIQQRNSLGSDLNENHAADLISVQTPQVDPLLIPLDTPQGEFLSECIRMRLVNNEIAWAIPVDNILLPPLQKEEIERIVRTIDSPIVFSKKDLIKLPPYKQSIVRHAIQTVEKYCLRNNRDLPFELGDNRQTITLKIPATVKELFLYVITHHANIDAVNMHGGAVPKYLTGKWYARALRSLNHSVIDSSLQDSLFEEIDKGKPNDIDISLMLSNFRKGDVQAVGNLLIDYFISKVDVQYEVCEALKTLVRELAFEKSVHVTSVENGIENDYMIKSFGGFDLLIVGKMYQRHLFSLHGLTINLKSIITGCSSEVRPAPSSSSGWQSVLDRVCGVVSTNDFRSHFRFGWQKFITFLTRDCTCYRSDVKEWFIQHLKDKSVNDSIKEMFQYLEGRNESNSLVAIAHIFNHCSLGHQLLGGENVGEIWKIIDVNIPAETVGAKAIVQMYCFIKKNKLTFSEVLAVLGVSIYNHLKLGGGGFDSIEYSLKPLGEEVVGAIRIKFSEEVIVSLLLPLDFKGSFEVVMKLMDTNKKPDLLTLFKSFDMTGDPVPNEWRSKLSSYPRISAAFEGRMEGLSQTLINRSRPMTFFDLSLLLGERPSLSGAEEIAKGIMDVFPMDFSSMVKLRLIHCYKEYFRRIPDISPCDELFEEVYSLVKENKKISIVTIYQKILLDFINLKQRGTDKIVTAFWKNPPKRLGAENYNNATYMTIERLIDLNLSLAITFLAEWMDTRKYDHNLFIRAYSGVAAKFPEMGVAASFNQMMRITESLIKSYVDKKFVLWVINKYCDEKKYLRGMNLIIHLLDEKVFHLDNREIVTQWLGCLQKALQDDTEEVLQLWNMSEKVQLVSTNIGNDILQGLMIDFAQKLFKAGDIGLTIYIIEKLHSVKASISERLEIFIEEIITRIFTEDTLFDRIRKHNIKFKEKSVGKDWVSISCLGVIKKDLITGNIDKAMERIFAWKDSKGVCQYIGKSIYLILDYFTTYKGKYLYYAWKIVDEPLLVRYLKEADQRSKAISFLKEAIQFRQMIVPYLHLATRNLCEMSSDLIIQYVECCFDIYELDYSIVILNKNNIKELHKIVSELEKRKMTEKIIKFFDIINTQITRQLIKKNTFEVYARAASTIFNAANCSKTYLESAHRVLFTNKNVNFKNEFANENNVYRTLLGHLIKNKYSDWAYEWCMVVLEECPSVKYKNGPWNTLIFNCLEILILEKKYLNALELCAEVVFLKPGASAGGRGKLDARFYPLSICLLYEEEILGKYRLKDEKVFLQMHTIINLLMKTNDHSAFYKLGLLLYKIGIDKCDIGLINAYLDRFIVIYQDRLPGDPEKDIILVFFNRFFQTFTNLNDLETIFLKYKGLASSSLSCISEHLYRYVISLIDASESSIPNCKLINDAINSHAVKGDKGCYLEFLRCCINHPKAPNLFSVADISRFWGTLIEDDLERSLSQKSPQVYWNSFEFMCHNFSKLQYCEQKELQCVDLVMENLAQYIAVISEPHLIIDALKIFIESALSAFTKEFTMQDLGEVVARANGIDKLGGCIDHVSLDRRLGLLLEYLNIFLKKVFRIKCGSHDVARALQIITFYMIDNFIVGCGTSGKLVAEAIWFFVHSAFVSMDDLLFERNLFLSRLLQYKAFSLGIFENEDKKFYECVLSSEIQEWMNPDFKYPVKMEACEEVVKQWVSYRTPITVGHGFFILGAVGLDVFRSHPEKYLELYELLIKAVRELAPYASLKIPIAKVDLEDFPKTELRFIQHIFAGSDSKEILETIIGSFNKFKFVSKSLEMSVVPLSECIYQSMVSCSSGFIFARDQDLRVKKISVGVCLSFVQMCIGLASHPIPDELDFDDYDYIKNALMALHKAGRDQAFSFAPEVYYDLVEQLIACVVIQKKQYMGHKVEVDPTRTYNILMRNLLFKVTYKNAECWRRLVIHKWKSALDAAGEKEERAELIKMLSVQRKIKK